MKIVSKRSVNFKNFFLIMENKFSNAGYHNKFNIYIGDINVLLLAKNIEK